MNSRPSLRRGLAVVAPLALVALGLTACNPDHITSMDSPTPSGSNLASTYAPAPHSSESEHASESASESGHASESGQPSESAGGHAAETSDSAADASILKSKSSVTYSVDSIEIKGKPVQAGTFRGLSVMGDPATPEGTQLTTIGLCSGAVFTVTGKSDKLTVELPEGTTTSKCGTSAGAVAAGQIHQAFTGKVTESTEGNKTTLKTADATLTLTATR